MGIPNFPPLYRLPKDTDVCIGKQRANNKIYAAML